MDAIQIGIVQTGVLLLFFFVLRSAWWANRCLGREDKAIDRLREQQEVAEAIYARCDYEKKRADSNHREATIARGEAELYRNLYRAEEIRARAFTGPFEMLLSSSFGPNGEEIRGKLSVHNCLIIQENLDFEVGIPLQRVGSIPRLTLKVNRAIWEDLRVDVHPARYGPLSYPRKRERPLNSFHYDSPGYKIQRLEAPVSHPIPVDESIRRSITLVGFWTGDPNDKSSRMVAFYGLGGGDPVLLETPKYPDDLARFMTLHVTGLGENLDARVRVKSATE